MKALATGFISNLLGAVFIVIGILPTIIFSFMMMASIYEDLKYAEPMLSGRPKQVEEIPELAIG